MNGSTGMFGSVYDFPGVKTCDQVLADRPKTLALSAGLFKSSVGIASCFISKSRLPSSCYDINAQFWCGGTFLLGDP